MYKFVWTQLQISKFQKRYGQWNTQEEKEIDIWMIFKLDKRWNLIYHWKHPNKRTFK